MPVAVAANFYEYNSFAVFCNSVINTALRIFREKYGP